MKYYRFLKLLRPGVACRRLSSTAAAASDIPVFTRRRTGKRIPKAQRKAMVEDYVNKYRAINAGKFPGVTNTVNQVGGSNYIIRAILQELEHNAKLSAVVTPDKNSVVGQTAHSNGISTAIEIVDSATPYHQTAEREEYGDGSEDGAHCLENVNHSSSQKIVAMPILTRTKDFTVEDDFGNQMTVDNELERRGDMASGCDVGVRFLQSRLVETTSPDRIAMKAPTDFECKLPGHSSEGAGLSSKVFGEFDKVSPETSEIIKYTLTDCANMKKQDDDSMLPAVEIMIDSEFEKESTSVVDTRSRGLLDKSNLVEKGSTDEIAKDSETENPQVCADLCHTSEAVSRVIDTGLSDRSKASSPASTTDGYSRETATQKTQVKEVEGTLWGNLKSIANSFINIWRKT